MQGDQTSIPSRFRDRADAGRYLGSLLSGYVGRNDVVVLTLPRGGVPVGLEIARALKAPLDVFLVRKLGVPGHEELAFGALASGGVRVLNQEVVRRLGLSPSLIEAVSERERAELERRERLYRGERPPICAPGQDGDRRRRRARHRRQHARGDRRRPCTSAGANRRRRSHRGSRDLLTPMRGGRRTGEPAQAPRTSRLSVFGTTTSSN